MKTTKKVKYVAYCMYTFNEFAIEIEISISNFWVKIFQG